ncbi:MAG: Rieske 2Fe-2S domain-containing protein [Bacteroidota bacterium]
MSESDRRTFLRISGMAVGGLAIGSVNLACAASLAPRMRADVANSRILFDTAIPELARPGDAVALESLFLEYPILLIRREDASFSAVSTECTHRGCEVKKERELLRCPCHDSAFDFSGNVLNGPAEHPLRHYAVNVKGSVVEILI